MKAIIIFYDSLNKRYLPNYQQDCETHAPNFERLGKHCVTFDHAMVGSMPCMPARRELHTGRHNFLHREWGPLEPFDDSMPELLKEHGVYTHLISDHLHYWEDGGSNYHTRYNSWEIVRGQEGDRWKGVVGEVAMPPVDYIPTTQDGTGVASGWKYDWANREQIKEEAQFPSAQVFALGCEFIEKNHQDDDWLLQIETFDPHEPFFSPERYLKQYPDSYEGRHFDWPRGKATQDEDVIAHCRHQYRSLVSMCDNHLGKVLDLMDTYDLWKDTMLIVGTDHGFLLAEHEYWGKNQMPYYDEIANTPCFIWDPKHPVQNERRSSLVQLIDWAPTLLDHFSLPIPADMEGKVLTDVITDDKPVREAAIYGVFSGHVNVTDGHHTYMRAAHPKRVNEIYNYTLVPAYMTRRMPVAQLQEAALQEPFRFTKQCQVLKIPAKDKFQVARFGSLLFDTERDPQQLSPLQDQILEQEMIQKMIKVMKANDCPKEQYRRLDIEKHL